MSKPAVTYTWSTDTYYSPQLPGAPTPTDPTNATKGPPSVGHQAQGYRPGDSPGAQEANALFNNLAAWTTYLDALFDTSDRLTVADLYHTTEMDHGLHASAFTASAGGGGVYTGSLWTFSTAGTLTVPLPFLTPGDKITTVEHEWTRGAGNVVTSLFRRPITVGGGITTIQTDTDSASSGDVNTTLTYNHVVLAANIYYLTVGYSAPNGSSIYVGGLLKASRPHP